MQGDELVPAQAWERIWRDQESNRRNQWLRAGRQKAWFELLGRFLSTEAPPAEVLELGCAPGLMLEQLHGLRPDHVYRGVDFAEDGLTIARNRFATLGVDIEVANGDIRDTTIEPADLVVSFGLIEHFDDPADALRHHRRLTKPGGHVAVTVPNYAHPVTVQLLRWFAPATLETHNLAIMSLRALHGAMTDAGLTDCVVGESGGPLLPNSRSRPGLLGRAYRFSSRAWNAGSVVLPASWPWSSSLWAVGTA